MLAKLGKLWELSFSLARANFKSRNEGSYLGIFWYLLNPLLMFVLLFLIFSSRTGAGIERYASYLFIGIIMFNFFQGTTTNATKILKDYARIIKSINFPKEALVGSLVLVFLFSHIFELIIFAGFMVFLEVPLWGLFWYFLILAGFTLFNYGVSLVFSFLSIYFVDFENIWAYASRILFFLTPVFYSIGGQGKLFVLNLFNPVFYYIEIARSAVVYSRMPELWVIFGAAGYTAAFLLAGNVIMRKLNNRISEML